MDGYIAVHTFSNMFYILRETEDFSIEDCRNTFNKLLYIFDVATLDKSGVIVAVNNAAFADLDGSMQHQTSIASELDYIVTRNIDDFENATVPAVTPEEFLKLVHTKNNA